MPSVALNLALNDGRVFSGDILQAVVLLDSNDPDTVIQEFVAEVLGVGRTGWINVRSMGKWLELHLWHDFFLGSRGFFTFRILTW